MNKLAPIINRKVYYGWIIVVISALAFMFSAPGQTYSISIFIDIYETELGYSKIALSIGYSIATIVSGSLLIIIGKATDRFGQKIMMVFVAVMLAITTFYNSYFFSLWMIYVGFFFLRYFGQGSMTLIPNSLVPQWFQKKRAFAISIATYGNLIATMFVPILNVWLIDTFSWQHAWRIWGASLLVLFVPLVILFVVNRPEDINLKMDNSKVDKATSEKALETMIKESWTLEQAVRTKEFWFVGLMSLIVPMFTTGITFHWISMMALRDVSRPQAAITIGLVAFPAIIMPLIARAFIDRYQPKYIFLTTLIMIFLSMLWLGHFVTGMPSAVMFILFYGLAVSIQGIALNTLWPNYFGRKYLGSIRGGATVFMVIGSALGPLPFSFFYDLTGDFVAFIWIMMGMTVIAMFMALAIKKPEKSEL